jgi:hypothetical protein
VFDSAHSHFIALFCSAYILLKITNSFKMGTNRYLFLNIMEADLGTL